MMLVSHRTLLLKCQLLVCCTLCWHFFCGSHTHLNSAIKRSTQQQVVREERQIPHPSIVAPKDLHTLAVLETPDPYGFVGTSGHQALLVERHTKHPEIDFDAIEELLTVSHFSTKTI